MKLSALIPQVGLRVFAGAARLDREVTGGYVSDLLSDVMAHSRAGDLWVTLQAHENAVAVAVLRDLAGILLVGGRSPDAETIARAEAEGIPIVGTPQRGFEVVARLLAAGVPERSSP